MTDENETKSNNKEIQIGYIMPISDTEGYKEKHWEEVRNIFNDTVIDLNKEHENHSLNGYLVSDIKGSNSIILNSIVNNIYECDLIICDVSSRNPNVMFELGMRLAFDKKIIIVKDDATEYSFDTSVINHIDYKKNLNYASIKEFQEKLKNEIRKSIDEPNANAGYLDSFGDFQVQTINNHEIPQEEAMNEILNRINNLNLTVSHLDSKISKVKNENKGISKKDKKAIEHEVNHVEFLTDVVYDHIAADFDKEFNILPDSISTDAVSIILNDIFPDEANAPLARLISKKINDRLKTENQNKYW